MDARKLIRVGGLSEDDWMRVNEGSMALSNAEMWIDDRRGLNDTDIRTAGRDRKSTRLNSSH